MFARSVGSSLGSWLRWGRILVLGLVGGTVQLFLLLAAGLAVTPWLVGLPVYWPFWLVVVLSACGYLVSALLEGFLASWRKGTIAAGKAAGQLVGGISVLTIAIPILVLVMIMFTTPRSTQGEVDPSDLRGLVALELVLLVVVEGFWARMVSGFGGWIGGAVGHRLASRVNQSRPPAAHQPSA